MQGFQFSPRFKSLLETTPRVNARGTDHEYATRLWMAISRMQEEDRFVETATWTRNDGVRC